MLLAPMPGLLASPVPLSHQGCDAHMHTGNRVMQGEHQQHGMQHPNKHKKVCPHCENNSLGCLNCDCNPGSCGSMGKLQVLLFTNIVAVPVILGRVPVASLQTVLLSVSYPPLLRPPIPLSV